MDVWHERRRCGEGANDLVLVRVSPILNRRDAAAARPPPVGSLTPRTHVTHVTPMTLDAHRRALVARALVAHAVGDQLGLPCENGRPPPAG